MDAQHGQMCVLCPTFIMPMRETGFKEIGHVAGIDPDGLAGADDVLRIPVSA
jgi:hypothetical protein